ncbi:MAG: SNF2-related protein, partial [Oscillospiraceae bacterium]|nr:SNF2-related protein [Oscillospiraceae bacterium]
EPLTTRLYLDKAGRGLSAELRFVYGDLEINPHPQWHETDPARIDQLAWLLRDEAREICTISRLKAAGFREQRPGHASTLLDPSGQPDTRYYLYGDRKLYLFLRDGLAALQADGVELFYAERFRQLKLLPMGKLGADISLDSSGSLLTVDMETNQYDPEELVAILQAYREKKHFIRLKDGAFLELEAQDEKTLDVLQEVEKWGGNWEGRTLNLPAFRAVPLQELLSQQGLLPAGNAAGAESLSVTDNPAQPDAGHMDLGLRLDPAFCQLHTALQDPADLAFDLPDGLQTILRSYQKAGFRWLCLLNTYHCGGILADDMGLGKTLQTLSFIRYLRETARLSNAVSAALPDGHSDHDERPLTAPAEGPAIVVAPTSLIYNWQDEARHFTPELDCLVIEGSKEQRLQQIAQLESCDLAIFSYTVLRQDIKELAEHHFSCCILDEAQAIKNPLTQTAKAVKRIKAGRRYALTGTPIENALSELWSIFDFLMPGYLFSYTRFHQEYELPVTRSGQEAQEAAERLRMLVSPFILRRMKRDVLKELPDKIESVLRCDMSPEQNRLYQAYLARARNELEELIASQGLNRSRMQILALLTRLRQLACHPALFLEDYNGGSGKLDALEELLDNLLASNHRILIFSQFTSMLSIIRQRQLDRGRSLFYIDGHVEARERLEQVRRFNEGEGEIFLISLKAGGTGLNLVGADTVIHYDPWWNPAVEQQATDRAHRIGQKRVVQIYRLISRGTIEEKILAFQDEKRRLVDRVIQPGEPLLKQLDLNQLRNLFTTD